MAVHGLLMASWKKQEWQVLLVDVFTTAGTVADGDNPESDGVPDVAVATGIRRGGLHDITY